MISDSIELAININVNVDRLDLGIHTHPPTPHPTSVCLHIYTYMHNILQYTIHIHIYGCNFCWMTLVFFNDLLYK